jgi:hypothetical protein
MGIKDISNAFNETLTVTEKLKNKKAYREQVVKLENQLLQVDGVLTGEELNKKCPVKHSFAGGCYVREIFTPAEQLIVTKIHKKTHPFFLLEGELSILTEDGINTIKAPYNGITKPGTKRVIYTHTDCRFITVHATDKTDIQEIEDEVIAKNFSDPEISLEDIKKLNNL